MSSNAQKFAATALDAFKAAGHYTDQEVGNAGGPSTTTMTLLRKVANGSSEMREPRSDMLKKIDAAAGWPVGSARLLWERGELPGPGQRTREQVYEGMKNPKTSEDHMRIRLLRQQTAGGLDVVLDRVLERLRSIEDRLDALEGVQPGLREVAHDEEHSIEFEQDGPEFP